MTSNIAEAAPSRQLHPAAVFSADIVRDCGDDELSAIIAVAEAGARPSSPPVKLHFVWICKPLHAHTSKQCNCKNCDNSDTKTTWQLVERQIGVPNKEKKNSSSRCPYIVRQEKNRTYCFSMHRSQYSFMPVDSLINIIFGCLVLKRQ
jgi:hypothetical protein